MKITDINIDHVIYLFKRNDNYFACMANRENIMISEEDYLKFKEALKLKYTSYFYIPFESGVKTDEVNKMPGAINIIPKRK